MKNLFIAAALASVMLAGCTTTGNVIPGTADPRVEQVRQQAVNLCGWLPTATTVANILATFAGANDVVNVASTAASGICNAITAKGLKRSGSVKYRGVTVTATRVR